MSDGSRQAKLPRVVVVGAGFAGLRVARGLRGAPAEVLVVDRNNHHTFSPLLYQVATAGLEFEEIAQPVRKVLRDAANVRFRLGEVTAVDLKGRRLQLRDGELEYDYLVLCAGSTTEYFGLPFVSSHSLGLKDLADAVAMRDRLLLAFEMASQTGDEEERRRLMTVVVIGGGPTGVELAGALAELKRHVLAHDYPELAVADLMRVILLEASDSLLGAFPASLQRAALRQLTALGVEVRLSSPVAQVSAGEVVLKDGRRIPASTAAWVTGVRAAPLAAGVEAEHSRSGRLLVEDTLQLPGWPNVFVAGDLAQVASETPAGHPMLAPVAVQQGELVAQNVRRLLRGERPSPFRYKNRGIMATIGRQAAVARVGPFDFSGFPAWLMWLSVHLFWLIGFRNRLLVFTNWAWNYIFYDRGVRLISERKKDGRGEPAG